METELPSREKFEGWLKERVALGDVRKRDINVGYECFLTEWLRAAWSEDATVEIDTIHNGSNKTDTPDWMFNFQCNGMYKDWHVERTPSGYRDLNNDRIWLGVTKYTPEEALAILGRTSDVA